MASPYDQQQEEGDDDMAAERELADDAMWKVIQKNTFTRWTNENLKMAKLTVVDLEKDLSDGLKLIGLIEVLSGKKFQKYNKRPNFRTQKFENVTMSLKFLEDVEGIKLVNIDSSDIVDQKAKLIMGLIWTLILHYSISMPMWEGEDPSSKDQTPKQRLLAWIQSKIPEKKITNFSSDWNDGTAIAALVDALAPGLCPDWPSLNPADKAKNAKSPMDLAEKWLDIPQLIKPEEMCNPSVDELSMMTYLSRFPNAHLKPGAPVQEKTNAARVRAFGPGLEPTGNVVGAPARFIVETIGAGKGDLEVTILNPKGTPEKCRVVFNNDRTLSYTCVYTPTIEGQYKVVIKFAQRDIPKSPFLVGVSGKVGDATKVVAQGPGIEKTGVIVKRKTYFEVITKGAGLGMVDVGIVDPQGKKDTIKPTITRKSDDVWYVEYTAQTTGLHSVNVFFAGKAIPKSPYPVSVSPEGGPLADPSKLPKPVACTPEEAALASLATPLKAAAGSTAPSPAEPILKPDGKKPGAPGGPGPAAPGPGAAPAKLPINASNVWATGRGIQPKGVRVGDDAIFQVHTENAGDAEPRVMLMGPGGVPERTTVKKIGTTFEYLYRPNKPGFYIINITFGGQQIPKSPFKVNVAATRISRVRAYGPGLETGVVGTPALFTVEPNGEGPIGFRIDGPSQAKIDVKKEPNGNMQVSYLPTAAGEYAIHVLSSNDDIPKSPFMANITDGSAPAAAPSAPAPAAGVDASKVTASGPGLEKNGVFVNKWADFTVDARQAGGTAPLFISALDIDSKPIEVTITDNKNGTYSCRYLATRAVKYTITITYGGANISKSPFEVFVQGAANASSVKVYGPAVEGPVKVKSSSYLIIDCKEAGPGEPVITLTNEKGLQVPFRKTDNKDRTYRVDFTAQTIGVYTATITFSGQPVPKSPFKISITSGVDVSKVKVYGPAVEQPVFVSQLTYLIVDCKEAGGGVPLVSVINDKGVLIPLKVTDNRDGTFKVEFTATAVGVYTANVLFTGQPVPKSPFKINVQSSIDLSKVLVKGLPETIPINKEVPFDVVTGGAGPGEAKVNITSPTGKVVPVNVQQQPDVAVAKFTATEPGPHTVQVTYADQPVPNSPFKVVAEAPNPFRVRVYGPAVEHPVTANTPTYLIVDFKEAGPGEPVISLIDDKGVPVPINTLDNKDKTFRVEFVATTVGVYTATVFFANQPVPNSPFKVTVESAADAGKVKVYGPAVEKEVAVHQSTYFIIDCKDAGPGEPHVTLTSDNGVQITPVVTDNKDRTYRVEFTTDVVGSLTANVSFASQPVPKSPFKITVGSATDASKVKVYGPAVEKPVAANHPTYLIVDAKEAGPGEPQITLTTESGVQITPVITVNEDRTYKVEFTTDVVGLLTANIFFADQPVPNSPFKITVEAGADASKVKVYGPAVEKPVTANQPTYLTVDVTEAGPGEPHVNLTSDAGISLTPKITDNQDKTYKVEFTPEFVGTVAADISFANQPVPNSPFRVVVEPSSGADASKVKVYGPAVETPVAPNLSSHLTVDCTEAGPGEPHVTLTSDAGVPLTPRITDNKDKTYKVEFTPEAIGTVAADVSFANQPVPNSPFKVSVEPVGNANASKVKVYGPAVERPVAANEPSHLTVDCVDAGPGEPFVTLTSDNGVPVAPKVTDNQDRTYNVEFTPESVGSVLADVSFAHQPVPNSPFRVTVEPVGDASKVKVYGPAVEKPVAANETSYLTVDCTEAGPGTPHVTLTSETGVQIPVHVVDNKDKTFRVEFNTNVVGTLTATVTYANQPVPKSPFKVTSVDISKVVVKELPSTIPIGKEVPFHIVTAGAGGPAPAKVNLISPSGKVTPSPVEPSTDGFIGKVTATEPGPHQVEVTYADQPIPLSPFPVTAVAEQSIVPSSVVDASKVKAYGPGLTHGITSTPCDFTIDTREAGPGSLGLTIDGPTEAKIECFDKGGGLFDVRYWPTEPGEYTTNILFDEKPIPNSPFKAQVNPAKLVDVSGIKTYGPGLEPTGVFLDSVSEFTVDAKSVTPTGEGKVKVLITNPSGTLTEGLVTNKQDGTYEVLYTPFEQGPTKIDVSYDGIRVPNSPFSVDAHPGVDASKVRVYGPGIEGGQPNKPQKFTINTRGAGQGGVGLSVVGPTEPQVGCVDNQDGTLTVEYLPDTPGDYEIGVTFADQPVPGSPFRVAITESTPFFPERVKVFGPGITPKGLRKGTKAVFSVVTAQAGVAKLEVTTTDLKTGIRKPATIIQRPSGTYDVEFTPDGDGPYQVDVTYGGQPVPGSPFVSEVQPSQDVTKVAITGEGIKPHGVPASVPVAFTIDTRQSGEAPLDVDVKTPQGEHLKPAVVPVGDGTFKVSYNPEEVGEYVVDVKYAGQEVPNAPFRVTTVPTGNPEKVAVPEHIKPQLAVGETNTITVRKSEAGYGNITFKIKKVTTTTTTTTTTSSVKDVDYSVVDNGDGTVTIKYTPLEEGTYTADIKFGGVSVPHGHFTQQVGRVVEQQLQQVKTVETFAQAPVPVSADHHPVDFPSISAGPDVSQVSAVITTPSGQKHTPRIIQNKDGTIKVDYQTTEIGQHTLQIFYAGVPVPNGTYNVFVHSTKPGQVKAFGPGLIGGISGQPTSFTVVTKDAGPGGLGLAIEGPSKAEIQCRDNKDGTATITYTPVVAGDYKIVVKFAGQLIAGAPYIAKISPPPGQEPSKQSHVSLGTTRQMSLTITETDLTNLSATIRTPSGHEEPVGLKKQPNGQLGISFTPREVGEHLVNVFRNGQPIPGSPFKIVISGSEVGNASRVKVVGRGITTGVANEINDFTIDTRDAGVAALSLSVQGPSKADIKCHDNQDGTTRVTYKPTEPGTYQVTVKYGDEHVPGSPFSINVGGQPSGRVTESIVRQQQAGSIKTAGSICELNITLAGINVQDIEGTVTSPAGVTERCEVVDLGGNRFTIKFFPKETGVHTVSLKNKGIHIPGSPFQFTVGPIIGGGPEKVRAIGSGLERGEVNKPCPFTIITREAGAGGLSLGIEGPSKAVIDFQDRHDGTSDVSYVVTEAGEYLVSVKFNGQHIPDSPFKVYILPAAGDSRKLHVQNLQQRGLQVNAATQFTVDFNGAHGQLKAKVVAPSGVETEATVTEVQKDRYAVNFVPKESGVHYVHVTLNGNHVPGSPYPVQVGQQDADASRVRAYGDGLHKGQTGQVSKFIVNTTNAGSGALSIGISGPSKIELLSREVDEGYEFSYTPLAPGDYFITIKYAGNAHIPGSPFKARVEGAGKPAEWTEQSRVVVQTVTKTTRTVTEQISGGPVPTVGAVPSGPVDASKVVVTGNGLQGAAVNQEAMFMIDGSKAGYNMLFVGIGGPEIPCEKIFVVHLGGLRYSVRYQLSQPGQYTLVVKWGDQHIPGSPFNITAK